MLLICLCFKGDSKCNENSLSTNDSDDNADYDDDNNFDWEFDQQLPHSTQVKSNCLVCTKNQHNFKKSDWE